MTNPLDGLYTEEEQALIERCISKGNFDSIVPAIESLPVSKEHGIFVMTPAKEKALEALLKQRRPAEGYESEVMQELRKKEIEGYRIETPEQEKEWQERLDAERAAKQAEQKGEAAPAEEEPIPADDLSEIEMTKAEIMEELKKKGVEFKPQQSKAELSALLDANLS